MKSPHRDKESKKKKKKKKKNPPVPESFFNEKRIWHRCFPVNFEEFLRTPFLQSTSG